MKTNQNNVWFSPNQVLTPREVAGGCAYHNGGARAPPRAQKGAGLWVEQRVVRTTKLRILIPHSAIASLITISNGMMRVIQGSPRLT